MNTLMLAIAIRDDNLSGPIGGAILIGVILILKELIQGNKKG